MPKLNLTIPRIENTKSIGQARNE